jgi:hypothetical protein
MYLKKFQYKFQSQNKENEMKYFTSLILGICLFTAGCAKTVTAPVPGSVNTLDATAFRVTADTQAAIEVIKTWQQCSVNGFPTSGILVDGVNQPCDATAGTFPLNLTSDLNKAISAFNLLAAAGKAYHSGASSDATGLTNAINQASAAIAALLGNASTTVNPASATGAAVKAQLAATKGGK